VSVCVYGVAGVEKVEASCDVGLVSGAS